MTQYQIVAVHGTNATDSKTRGSQWWQRDSDFSREILRYLDTEKERIVWVPYPWSGENREAERALAGKQLAADLRHVRPELPAQVTLIGHSHGGNVCTNALEQLPDDVRARVKAICVGTPVLGFSYTIADALYNALKVGAILCALAFAVSYFHESFFPNFWFPSVTQLLSASGLIALVVFALSLPLVGEALTGVGPNMGAPRRSGKIMRIVTRLYSEQDEVINGLRNASRQRLRIATARTTRWPAAVMFGLAFYAVLIQDLPKDWTAAQYLADRRQHELSTSNPTKNLGQVARNSVDLVGAWRAGFMYIYQNVYLRDASDERRRLSGGPNFVTPPYIVASIVPAAAAGALVSRVFGSWIVAILVNMFFRTNVLTRAFGLGSGFRSRWRADPNPQNMRKDSLWLPLPKSFDVSMSRVTDSAASSTLRAAREEVGVAAVMPSRGVLEAVASSIKWNELFHTTYFECEEFQRLFAMILVYVHEIPPSNRFREMFELHGADTLRWYAEIKPGVIPEVVAGPASSPLPNHEPSPATVPLSA